ncbi:phosphatase PAP2 family protein [Crystallibacter degradans]|uniref:phosphatase PAP2 family protein n=1 Tax=Crystallibacter degradans TaxID=2726743 RepID=UPI0014739AD7|nr:phosphatase PAP2 family protein [Arthrobacter sp. SF27]NMR28768.1 phosphatase PAP2 family protein [Arthrobacter sp. SF27]
MTPGPHEPPKPTEDRFVGSKDLTQWKTPVGRFFARAMEWASRALGPHAALVITLTAGAILATALTALSAEVYEAVVETDGVAVLDQPLLDAAETVRSPEANTAVTAFTNLGGSVGMTVLAALALLVLTLRRRSWTPLILMVAAAAGSLLMTIAGKELIGRTRPPLSSAVAPFEYSPSFPSGHSLNSIVIAGIVAYLLVLKQQSKRTRTLTIAGAALFAVAMGLSRVFLGHHWFTDVLVAWTLGTAWLATVITIHRLFLTVSYRRAGSRRRAQAGPP